MNVILPLSGGGAWVVGRRALGGGAWGVGQLIPLVISNCTPLLSLEVLLGFQQYFALSPCVPCEANMAAILRAFRAEHHL